MTGSQPCEDSRHQLLGSTVWWSSLKRVWVYSATTPPLPSFLFLLFPSPSSLIFFLFMSFFLYFLPPSSSLSFPFFHSFAKNKMKYNKINTRLLLPSPLHPPPFLPPPPPPPFSFLRHYALVGLVSEASHPLGSDFLPPHLYFSPLIKAIAALEYDSVWFWLLDYESFNTIDMETISYSGDLEQ
jgi:hypothetical protein